MATSRCGISRTTISSRNVRIYISPHCRAGDQARWMDDIRESHVARDVLATVDG